MKAARAEQGRSRGQGGNSGRVSRPPPPRPLEREPPPQPAAASPRGESGRVSRPPPPEPPERESLERPAPGCRIYRHAVPLTSCKLLLPGLLCRIPKLARPIVSGQTDGKRLQLKAGTDEDVSKTLLEALRVRGELKGRSASEVNALHSKPRCQNQELHWDFDPAKIKRLPRGSIKPASAILALQDGACIMVMHAQLGKVVPLKLNAGDLLVFEGDVAHHGASYHSANTRAHVYLDVAHMKRVRDHTWFPRKVSK